ncbi:unnamed protein product, partial [Ranitomeya imitator]
DYTNIDIFLRVVEDDLKKIGRLNGDTSPNLNSEEWEALEKLEKNDQIIVKSSDKGGNLVILDHQRYVGMCRSILDDRETYGVLENDPTDRFIGSLMTILDIGLRDKLISYNEYKFLVPRTPTIPTFYALPKVHKGLSPLKGRPIVSGVGSLSQNVGIYIDNILRLFVTSLPSYVRDTSDLLQKVDGVVVEQGTILGSIDVEALYSSIPHSMGLKALEYYLRTRAVFFEKHSKFVVELMEFVLTHNYFLFNGKYFHQLRGTAMGCSCAPSYANLLLGWWEETVVFSGVEEWWTDKISAWYRYIDDVLVMWNGTANEFNSFVQGLNDNCFGLKFTSENDEHELAFLDVKITINASGTLDTRLFRKPTSSNALLRWESHHPVPLKRGIPRGQYLRVRRNCSDPAIFRTQAYDLRERFRERGYPDEVLDPAFRNAMSRERHTLLQTHRELEAENTPRIIGTYDNQTNRVFSVLKKHWGILQLDETLADIIPNRPQITFRRGRSLKDRLVHSHYKRPKQEGTWLDRRINAANTGACYFYCCLACWKLWDAEEAPPHRESAGEMCCCLSLLFTPLSTPAIVTLIAIGLTAFYYVLTKPRPVHPPIDLSRQSIGTQGGARRCALLKDDSLMSYYYEDAKTLYEVFKRGIRVSGNGDCLGYRKPNQPYQWITYQQVADRAENLGSGLIQKGCKASPDQFIGVFSQNRPEVVIAELACFSYSMVVVPLYDTLGAEAIVFIVNRADLSLIVCDKHDKAAILLHNAEKGLMPSLKIIILMEECGNDLKEQAAKCGVELLLMSDVEYLGKENFKKPAPPSPEDLCLICFTSGTTGDPKGAMLTHKNVVADASSFVKATESTFVPMTSDIAISYLPMAHVFERWFRYTVISDILEVSNIISDGLETVVFCSGAKVGFFQGDIRLLTDDMKTLRPTVFPSVPRLLNRIYDKIQSGAQTPTKKFLLDLAITCKSAEVKKGIIRNDSIWDKLIFKRVQVSENKQELRIIRKVI